MVVIETKKAVFDKCINADYQFFVDNKQGEVIYKIFNAPRSISGILDIMSNIFIEMFLAMSVFTVLLSMSWKFVCLVIVGGIGYYYLTKRLSVVVSYKAGRKQLKSGQKEQVILNEYTSGVKQIKVFETFEYWKKMLENALNTFWFYNRKATFWSKFPEALLWMVLYISIGAAVIIIKLQYPGDFKDILPLMGTFAFGVFMILPKISKFGVYRMKFMHLLPEMEIVHKLLEDENYNKIKNGDGEFNGLKSGIKLKNVTFAHKERDVLLDDFSLDIKKDKTTALVGASGSGKSTIVDLLLRLYDVDKGGVYIDDVNIKDYDIYSFRRKIGFVSQDTFIYNASVKDNIAFGNEYTDHEILEAARFANADEFIRNLPEGYDTIVGDRGMRISGGEKQRIAIARAMIRKPEILILDEATSSLDNVSESVVQNTINKISENCTTLIIAHRLSTIQKADAIHVLDNGKVVESGTHKELLRKRDKYWELYNIQKQEDKETDD
jgi:ATP-binding cassette subfamily B protein/subfamily B ATP-binding cassette protein MsbA